ncbi:MAG: single-stranded-DNA-specific exonuclease RecJ [Candidatus Omnitrophica bacterium]|nr:single-stranded-DNA-specific exonuclease RecJ [Candidatus Omnitrophota bacterium]
MQRDWQVLEQRYQEINKISESLGISRFLAQLLVNRGINHSDDAERFLNPRLSNLHDPFLFRSMENTVQRIRKAIRKKEKILIYGDYDVDGITAMAVLIKTLEGIGGDPLSYIPHRIEEGYGISEQGIRFVLDRGVSLVITVDCGISNVSEIEVLNRKGVDVIITDHHEPDPGYLPLGAYSVLNPFLPGESYPERYLSGVGVAFKLAQALSGRFSQVEDMLDLVVLGTVADVSIIKGENRVLVRHGLSILGETQNAGIKALIEVAHLNRKVFSSRDIGFILGPRINAMGRLGSAELALKLFLTDSVSEAKEISLKLNTMNRRRQEIEADIYNSAVSRIEREINFKDEHVIVLGDNNWHQGVLGIVAGKLAERYSRPVILLSLNNKIATGSGRAKFEGIHLFKLLDKCKKLLITFGGHKSACGVKMQEELLPEFKSELNKAIEEEINENTFVSSAYIDSEFNLSEISLELLKDLEKLAPFGEGNPFPTFISRRLRLKVNPVSGNNNGNSKNSVFWITDGRRTYEARGKNFQSWATLIPQGAEFNLIYNLRLLNNRMENSVCLYVQDFEIIKQDAISKS